MYALSEGKLKQWTLSSAGAWSGPVTQQWSDTTDVQASFGIGVAKGYLQTASGPEEHLFAAIPVVPAGSSYAFVELAWRDEASGRWTKLGDDHWGAERWPDGIRLPAREQPGLAYEPFDRDSNMYEGRFYLLYNIDMSIVGITSSVPPLLVFSEGNDLSAAMDRRLRFDQLKQVYTDAFLPALGNVSLLYDLDFDNNVRGACTFDVGTQGRPNFAPMADGIFNGDLADQDDYAVIKSNLRCTLGQGSCL